MHLALGLTIAPLQGEASFHRIVVSFQPLSKVCEFWWPLFLDLLEPGIQAFSLSLPQHRSKVRDELIRLSNLLISFTQLGQILLLPVQALLFFKRDPMSHLRS
jgi:hypothetical protein